LLEMLSTTFPVSPIASIDLRFNRLSNDAAKVLASFLTRNKSVTSLCLRGNEIGQRGCDALAASLAKNTTLLTLDISSNAIGESQHTFEVTQEAKNPKEKAVVLTRIDYSGVPALAESLLSNSTLTSLDVGGTDAGTVSLVKFATALRSNTALTELNLNSPLLTSVQEETTIHLSTAIAENTALKRLSLARHGIRDHGAEWIADALKRNVAIQFLDLSSNRLTTTGVASLIVALQHRVVGCKVALACNFLRSQLQDDIDTALEGDAGVSNKVEYFTDLDQHSLTATPVR